MQKFIDEFHAALEQFLVTKAAMLAADLGRAPFEHPATKRYAKARTRYRAAVRDLADELQATERRVRVVLLGSSPCSYCGEMVADDKYMQHLADEHSVKDILANAIDGEDQK